METNTMEAMILVPEQSTNGTHQPAESAPKNKTQLICRIIEREMKPDGKVDNQRVLTLARVQGPQFEPTMRDVQQQASVIRKRRGLHDKVLSERMKRYAPKNDDSDQNDAPTKQRKSRSPEHMSKIAKAMWVKRKAQQFQQPAAVSVSYTRLELASARAFLFACNGDAAKAVECLKLVQSLTTS